MHSLLVIALFVVSAQEVMPNSPPSGAAKSGRTVGKLNAQDKTDKTEQEIPGKSPEMPCNKCFTCPPVEQVKSKSKEEQAKADSLDLLYRRYMWATIIGVVGGLIGVGILIWQAILTRAAANAAKASADALINSERAWILVETADLHCDTRQKLTIRPTIKKLGQTTARIKKIYLGGARPLQLNEPLSPIPVFEGSWDFDFGVASRPGIPISWRSGYPYQS